MVCLKHGENEGENQNIAPRVRLVGRITLLPFIERGEDQLQQLETEQRREDRRDAKNKHRKAFARKPPARRQTIKCLLIETLDRNETTKTIRDERAERQQQPKRRFSGPRRGLSPH